MIPFEVDINGDTIQVELNENSNIAVINGEEVHFSIVEKTYQRFLIRIGTKLFKCDNILVTDENVSFLFNGEPVDIKIKDEEQVLLERLGFTAASSDLQGIIVAPMPGKILDIPVSEGDEVDQGEAILILEAMKMENELKASMAGFIHSIQVKTGESVEKNQILLEIKARG
tara:strand:+ start:24700 stop:25212 length:513 start_codon:yes stop_codon:yes gene_type:complete